MKCMYCGKGRATGHAVSHAKNRVKRFFKPNLQILKVMRGSGVARVKFCTRCIKRLKKEGSMGMYRTMVAGHSAAVAKTVSKEVAKITKSVASMATEIQEKKTDKKREKLQLDSIVGKQS